MAGTGIEELTGPRSMSLCSFNQQINAERCKTLEQRLLVMLVLAEFRLYVYLIVALLGCDERAAVVNCLPKNISFILWSQQGLNIVETTPP